MNPNCCYINVTPKHGVKYLAEGNAKQAEGARITPARLRQLAAELPDRYTAPLMHLSRARVLSGRQLDRLLWQPGTASRTAERARQRALSRFRHAQRLAAGEWTADQLRPATTRLLEISLNRLSTSC